MTPPAPRAPDRVQSARPIKRSFRIRGHATSISLETAFWDVLNEAADARGVTTAVLVAEIDAGRGDTNLSSAVRVWLLDFVRGLAAEGGRGAVG